MCGIVGYLGPLPAADVIVSGLKRLEYRGYDSAGLATLNGKGIVLRRTVGHVSELKDSLIQSPLPGHIGIGHTRWATHGKPSERNAHPHCDASSRIALVHNGVIENHQALRSYLEQQGIKFQSETDSEALAQLIGFLYAESGQLFESVRKALEEVRGTFGLVVLCADHPETLIAARRGSPLIVGRGENEFHIASDANAIVAYTPEVSYLHDNEIIQVGSEGILATTIDARPVEKEFSTLQMSLEEIELGEYPHYMLKEIHEQPGALRNTMRGRIRREDGSIVLDGLRSRERQLPQCRRVLLFGCGTAWHAGLIGRDLFERLAGIPADVEYASELRYRNPLIDEGTLAIAISQSGETADTLAALREVQLKGATCLGVVNAVGSTIARETDAGVYLHVGPEIGVASTKAFTAQVAVLAMMATHLGRRRRLSPEDAAVVISELESIPDKVAKALDTEDQIRRMVPRLLEWDNWLYLGRGVNFPVALEGALKLKEISYIHAEGLPAAEMKHGPIALIDRGMPVVVIAPQDHTYDKVLANIEEVRSREGYVIAIASEGDKAISSIADEVIRVPQTLPILSPLVTSIPLQLMAYHAALGRGCDVDRPRNLAKSVTVE
jgi:glucosamine--fructose-6-phosphate aminotransferase (isomerizing)